MPDDYLSTTQTTGTVAVGGSARGEIETSKDFDWFAVDLVAGHTYVIGLEGADSGGGALQDPVLRGLYDADGNRIAGTRDNDGGAGRDARLTFTATTTGAYYIEARGRSNQTGEYTVRVTEWVDTDAERGGATDLGDITELAGLQFPAASLDGSSDSVDYWRFTLSEARRVGLGLRQQDANADLFLEDAEGNVLYSGTEEGTASEWISQTLPAGTYFVRVEAQEEGANEFKLRYGVSGANPDVVAALKQQEGADEAPAFVAGSYAFDLAENTDGGTVPVSLGLVQATDPEDETITYSIEAGDSGGLFAIDTKTGALSYQGAGEDYESGTTSYELTVRASDGTNATDTIVTVNVTDVEEYVILAQQGTDEAPVFAQPSYAFDLAENADGALFGIAVAPVVATDPDNDRITYSIEAGDPDGLFMIDAETGLVVYLGAGEDYESGTRSYELTVRASDGGLHSDVTVTVNVTDVAEAPAFAEASYAFSLAENADGGTISLALGRVTATDPENSTITYSIESGDSDGLFAIDPGTGALSYEGAGEDYESGTTSYELRVRASDGGLHSDVTVTVNVTDVADVEEYVSLQQEASVSEPDGQDLPAGASTTGRVAVGDMATGNIETAGDRDWFAVTFEADRIYRIDLEGSETGAGTLYNPYLRGVHDANGVLIARTTDDDDGAGRNSREYFTAEEAGTYYVAAGAWGTRVGAYTLSVTDVTDTFTDDFAAGPGTSGSVAAGGSATGEIELEGDRDWFAVTLDAGRTYRIDLEGSRNGAGTLYNPYLRGVHDADGVFITGTTDNDGGAGYNARVTFTADEAGTYYVAAGAYGTRKGTYTLSVVDVTDGIPDDFEAGTGTSGAVAVGGSATGEIDFYNDRDWFAVELDAGGTYQIDLEGEDTDAGTLRLPYLYGVHDADGVLIAGTTHHGGGTGCNSQVYFTAEDAGTYYVAAGSHRADEGTYKLSVVELADGIPDDFAAETGTSGAVTVGGSARGEIEVRGDHDWFAVELDAGATYQIDLKGSSTGAGTLLDPYLRGVHDADGNFIAGTTDNHGGVGLNSRVRFTAEEAGAYYVAAGAGAYGFRRGTYKLSVTEVPDDLAAGTGTSGVVEVGGSVTGDIDYAHDRDWFAVELEAGATYRIDLKGSPTGSGTLSDPYLYGVHNANGGLIPGTTDDDGGAGYNSRVTFTATADATYYVAAGGFDGDEVGTYRLSVSVEEVM